MTGQDWITAFYEVLNAQKKCPTKPSDKKWARWMFKRIRQVGEKLDCYTISRGQRTQENGEYLGIDATQFSNSVWTAWKKSKWVPKGYDPFVIPEVVVEHENGPDMDYIAYCAWKLCCHRAPISVLVCYQPSNRVGDLVKKLTAVVSRGKLMEGTPSELIVVAGREGLSEDSSWEEYFPAFRWSPNGFKQVAV